MKNAGHSAQDGRGQENTRRTPENAEEMMALY
jgi:hypothetical protein